MEEGVVSMLYESGMPTAFWGKGQATAWEPWNTHGEVCLHWIPSGLQGPEVLQPCDQEGGHSRES